MKRELATLSQDQNSVSLYFTKLKSAWDELNQYRPVCSCSCTCSGTKLAIAFLEYEYLMNLLIGLNESYAQTRAQLLLMDPPPTINKAFSLVRQEEQQRVIGNSSVPSSANSSFALAVSQSPISGNSMPKPNSSGVKRKERAFCARCGVHGHTIDRCYKLHGYPPGYRSQGQCNTQRSTQSQGSSQFQTSSKPSDSAVLAVSQNASSSSMATDMNAQCQQLIQLLPSQMHVNSESPTPTKT